MNSTDALQAIGTMAGESGINLGRCTPDEGLRLMLDFYCGERAADCDVEAQGDMLLYQWGTYDWGRGAWFELDITRQFIRGDGEDENIWQLSLTFKYRPTGDLGRLGRGDRWCERPSSAADFEAAVRTSAVFQALALVPAEATELDYECAG